MELYCGIDLHSNNNYVAIKDREFEDVAGRRLANDLGLVLAFLEPYRQDLAAIAVESTYNWYWLVDGLIEAGYDVRLVNTNKASKHDDMKYTDDQHDARWIALLLALGILPEGYIVPPKERGLRDLLRRRSFLVQKRTALMLSLRTLFERSTGKRVSTEDLKNWDSEMVHSHFDDCLVAESIVVMLPVLRALNTQIKRIQKTVLSEGKLRREFQLLKTAPGIGDILGLTIMCETGDIARFKSVNNYTSYCRCAKSEHTSNRKKKRAGNRKNGNQYLSWAYSEAAHHAKRLDPLAQRFCIRKNRRSHPMVTKRALAAKIARGSYFVMRDQVPFDTSRAFC
jgi:transposase